jgi:ERCC4-related helicase
MTQGTANVFQPGDLVHARGREWITLPHPAPGWLTLRPLTGGEQDSQTLCLALEQVRSATFAPPMENSSGSQDSAQLLADALRLSLRRGAGPFRSAARVAFEPRAYQLVPLLMALRLTTVRLLIADDVGVGKTVEAGLILRELLDRGEVDSFSILCPPHLVEQWTMELRTKFAIDAVAVTTSSVSRLERGLPAAQTIFNAYPFTVVSLDYIKAEQRRESFARSCPPMIVVDEAHSCVGVEGGRQQRFDLLSRLAADTTRHIVLLTATPHSGNESAFDRLLTLLDPSFAGERLDDDAFRRRLARHFVQRRRLDVTQGGWQDNDGSRVFPEHKSSEPTYSLAGPHQDFHDEVINYCLGIVESAGAERQSRRLAFWGTLALMRCVGSSVPAALSALRNRAITQIATLREQLLDEEEDTDVSDIEPDSGLSQLQTAQDPALAALTRQAEALLRAPDPKFDKVFGLLGPLLDSGANPVIFCRYLATADSLGEMLQAKVGKRTGLRIEVVTGKLTPDERRRRIEAMAGDTQRLLVATDCLSEGINLQALFDSVIHYDLSWNPTRHQQREGRVNRYGQSAEVVHSALLYSPDSAIDGAVLSVILDKAKRIREATGVTVPLPEKQTAIDGALMNAVLLHKGRSRQLSLDLMQDLQTDADAVEVLWRDAGEGERRSRTRFAQNTLKPSEVLPEWQRWRTLMGSPHEVHSFVSRAFDELKTPLGKANNGIYLAHLKELPDFLREQLALQQFEGTLPIVFEPPTNLHHGNPSHLIGRNHPLTSALADAVLESALSARTSVYQIARSGAWFSPSVSIITTVILLRLRYKLTVTSNRNSNERVLLVEEAETLAFGGVDGSAPPTHSGEAARTLLSAPANATLAEVARQRQITRALTFSNDAARTSIASYAVERAALLESDHLRVRAASGASLPRITVVPVLPPDIVGVFVLLPSAAQVDKEDR